MAGNDPVAWAVVYFDEIDCVFDSKQDCERFMETQCRRDYMTAIPLYRSPAAAKEDEARRLRDEVELLREAIRRFSEQDATLSVVGGSVTVEMDATLTDNERGAIIAGEESLSDWALEVVSAQRKAFFESHAATLRGLLERTK
jgi:hypothetical protein